MDLIELSVIILTYCRVARCQDSLLQNQAALAHRTCEWWIINNGGDEFTLPPNLSQPTTLLHMPTNLGTAARNHAEPKGRYILMLDDDAYIERETIDAAIQEMEEYPSAGGIILPVANEGCLLQTVFHGCAVLFAASALNIINGYPEHYLYYGEEYDVAFRLATANFYLRPLLSDVPAVRHVRDRSGRNMDHIMYRLVRNNAYCWIRCLPRNEIIPALRDTLTRYYDVSRKENARAGFWRGVRDIPAALWRGWCQRAPMNRKQFEKITLLDEIKRIRPPKQQQPLILCGIGKFMHTTVRHLRANGWQIAAIAEHNPAFPGRRICGIPVITQKAAQKQLNIHFLTGFIAAPDNRKWENELMSQKFLPTHGDGLFKLFTPAD